ncbi:MAG: hypothetical protein A2381_10240 [Bdellovibrionales bacterium RIFOXYB1_FULL_37_110]|nr:MAG: hypothetical protein A2417_02755 [Bdellovibrionales bacterium RIFOXYC1_FULL_37_79]OFZ61143.1 MAG: hypothetical protein A2381_10240 [Bdellovibrionales bacterium RIFOXYB1_FULL_37_110]OFZ65594.1 MAG: hypothetical protein A2577_02425 [Bdellovibrionales bacterium RIFOXYD1_FULL_36_51]
MHIELIIIGNEIISGDTPDANGPWLSQYLETWNAKLDQISIIPDQPGVILNTLSQSINRSNLIIISGGLGPTDDDITKKTLAGFFHKDLKINPVAQELVKSHYVRLKRQWVPEHNFYHMIPEGFEPLSNNIGLAPGLFFQTATYSIIVAPGVPLEFQSIIKETIPLKNLIDAQPPLYQLQIRTKNITEEMIFNEVGIELLKKIRPFTEICSYPRSFGGVDLVIKSQQDIQTLKEDFLNSPLKQYIWQIGNLSLPELIIQMSTSKKIKLGLAESCTGGLISSLLTDVSGSSACYMGSIVAYSYEIKMDLLGVKQATLDSYGAVSKETAWEMAKGAFEKLKVDIAIGTTGIAGPMGGTKEKPVGTIGIGLFSKNYSHSDLLVFRGNRIELKKRFSQAALHKLLEVIKTS